MGQSSEESQGHYVRALAFGLVPDQVAPKTAERLVELIRLNGNRLGTGFLTTGHLLPTLAGHGYADVAYELLLSGHTFLARNARRRGHHLGECRRRDRPGPHQQCLDNLTRGVPPQRRDSACRPSGGEKLPDGSTHTATAGSHHFSAPLLQSRTTPR
nr:hypothetical protein [Arthrobacter sp. ISL-95]